MAGKSATKRYDDGPSLSKSDADADEADASKSDPHPPGSVFRNSKGEPIAHVDEAGTLRVPFKNKGKWYADPGPGASVGGYVARQSEPEHEIKDGVDNYLTKKD